MSWPRWAKANPIDLARFVCVDLVKGVRLELNRDDALADPGGSQVVAGAIYEALSKRDIRWAREAYDPQLETQTIRDPEAILKGTGDATCLDLAVLYAAICMANELLPLIAVFDDHALVLVSRTRGRRDAGSPIRVAEDGDWVDDGLIAGATLADTVDGLLASDAYFAVECTGFAASAGSIPTNVPEGQGRIDGLMPFVVAVTQGAAQFEFNKRDLVFAVDPAVVLDVHRNEPYEPRLARLNPQLRIRLQKLMQAHELFGGRDDELAWLDAARHRPASCHVVVGPSGTGKTALLVNWIDTLEDHTVVDVAYHLINRDHDLAKKEDVLRSLCQQLAALSGRPGELPTAVPDLHALLLELLTETVYPTPLVVVIDALDEADGWDPLASFLPTELAENLTLVLSARETAGIDWLDRLGFDPTNIDQRRLQWLTHHAVHDLLLAAGGASAELAADLDFVTTLHDRSKGDPLYLRFVVPDIRDGRIASTLALADEPKGLTAYFERWWERDISGQAGENSVQDLLSYLLVARGPLTRSELTSISDTDNLTGFTVDAAIESIRRFVTGDKTAGYVLCHPRFQEYLASAPLADVKSASLKTLLAWCGKWSSHRSDYALNHYASHLIESLNDAADSDRAEIADTLVRLQSDPAFEAAFMESIADVPLLQRQAAITLEHTASLSDNRSAVRTVSAAMALVNRRSRLLEPQGVFDAAARLELDAAKAALDLHALPAEVHEACLLIMTWLVAIQDTAQARTMLDDEVGASPQLRTLAARVRHRLDLAALPEFTFSYYPHELRTNDLDEYHVRHLVAAFGGADAQNLDPQSLLMLYADPEMISMLGDSAELGLAQMDAPRLVQFAIAEPGVGTELIEEYVELVASNPYREYRDQALLAILEAVACMPHESDVVSLGRGIVERLLSGGSIDYREGLRLAHTVLVEAAGRAPDRTFSDCVAEAEQAALTLEDRRGAADQWGHHSRRHGVLAELAASMRDDITLADALLERARHLPRGFAGFQASTSATLAESIYICDPEAGHERRRALDHALESANNVQNQTFCAATTARIYGLRDLWDRLHGADVRAIAERFAHDAQTPEFAPSLPRHDPFGHRDRSNPRNLPMPVVSTLRDAGILFAISPRALERFNPDMTPDAPLTADIRIPDPAEAPKVAALLSARIVVDSLLSNTEKVTSIQALVPTAAADMTALDTVLVRLLIAAQPTSRADLDAIEAVAPDDWLIDHVWRPGLEA